MSKPSPKILRCAIYTRVSTEYGLEQDFNSLDAQREASEAYIKSQAHEGWRLQPGHYIDGGFSGGSLDRPALQKLLTAIRERRIDVVVVYKVDRLTRSLADFAKLVELFDAQEVSFVSVTQSFNTTTSMGRLTLNVLLSFAQFEREVTGERIRDKVAASKRKGMRMGGPVPLGYDTLDKKLVLNQEEAERVRNVFQTYLKHKSLTKAVADLRTRGVVTKRTVLKDGRIRGGLPFSKNPLNHMLKNRIFIGDVGHKGKWFPGEHPGIVDKAIFEEVQAVLVSQAADSGNPRLDSDSYRLIGKIFDSAGHRMTAATARKNSFHYRYYVSSAPKHGAMSGASIKRVSADQIEHAVTTAVTAARAEADPVDEGAEPLGTVTRLVVRSDKLTIEFASGARGKTKTIIAPWSTSRFPRREILNAGADEEAAPIRAEKRARILQAIARSQRWVDDLISCKARDLDDIAKREGRSERSVRMSINLAFLRPEIVEAAIAGKLRKEVTLASLIEMPSLWSNQRP